MSIQTFCQNCGTPRSPGFRFCGSCGWEYEAGVPRSTAPTPAPQSPSPSVPSDRDGRPTNQLALIGGIAWLATAGLFAYLAYQQWTLSQDLTDLGVGDLGLGAYAAWNAISAAITLFLGARLIANPTRRMLDVSAAWAVLSVVGGVLQLATGTGNEVFALSTITAAIAGVLSYVGRQAIPAAPGAHAAADVAPGWGSSSSTSAAPAVAKPSSGGSKAAERVVILLIVLAAIGGGYLVLNRSQGSPEITGHTINGTFDLITTSVNYSPADCQGTGGYVDIQAGLDIVVRNGSGTIIGTDFLTYERGRSSDAGCSFSFEVDVPDTDFYSVEVGSRGELTYSRAEMVANAWTVSLTLGD